MKGNGMPQHLRPVSEAEKAVDEALKDLTLTDEPDPNPQATGSLSTRSRQSFANQMRLLDERATGINLRIATANADHRRAVKAFEDELEQIRLVRAAIESAHTLLTRNG